MSQQVNLVTKAYLLFYISNYKLVTANWSGQFYDFHPAWIHPEHMWRLCQAGTHPQCHPIGQEGTPQQHHRLEQLQDQVKWRIQEQGHLWQRGQPDFRPPSSLWIHKNWLNWISPNNTWSFVIGVQQMYDLEHRLRWARWRRTIGPTPLFMTQAMYPVHCQRVPVWSLPPQLKLRSCQTEFFRHTRTHLQESSLP